MRYALEPMTELLVSLVRGKQMWRITGAEAHTLWYYRLLENRSHQNGARVLSLLLRLLPEEGREGRVYDIIHSFFSSLSCASSKDTCILEELAVFFILGELGYVETKKVISLEEENIFTENTIRGAQKNRSALLREIQSGLYATQL